ncbi:hypothetical protein M0638_28130 [Roseomonas sp. NAR14]|uniref:Uncharacterized protein n=1 Tax=Roseomonas acroporae TaxID=2937791 RepID=A0A9X1YDL8_9PROT|nr:hypothetical protein [Roseomonas acroporae]MCK8788223.1 hypothetical protein [Roseomonas acroporae]
MSTRQHHGEARRDGASLPLELRRLAPALCQRARIEALAAWLIDLLDRMDGDVEAEPDHDGEEEPGEAWAQPPVLCVELVPARRIARRAAA